jgi:hypothetical protein
VHLGISTPLKAASNSLLVGGFSFSHCRVVQFGGIYQFRRVTVNCFIGPCPLRYGPFHHGSKTTLSSCKVSSCKVSSYKVSSCKVSSYKVSSYKVSSYKVEEPKMNHISKCNPCESHI